jgi:hypothetical protein
MHAFKQPMKCPHRDARTHLKTAVGKKRRREAQRHIDQRSNNGAALAANSHFSAEQPERIRERVICFARPTSAS